MNDKEKALKRFNQTAEEIEIILIPQCNTCKMNIDFVKCAKFNSKPKIYMSNKKVCPRRIEIARTFPI